MYSLLVTNMNNRTSLSARLWVLRRSISHD